MTVLSTITVVARKPSKCIWCGEVIEPKWRCAVQTVRDEDGFQCGRYHAECYEAALNCPELGDDYYFSEDSFKRGTTEER
jgi:hypothetical protein